MSPFRSRLLWKAFLSVVLGLALWFPLFYWLTVPFINRLAYEVEEKAARNVLNNVAEMVGQSHHDLLAWRQSALDAHRRELKNIVLVIDSWAKELDAEVAAGRRTRPQARQELLGRLRQVRYGNNDYLWAADYRSLFLSHPDAAFDHRDASTLRDSQGRLVLPPMVEQARKSGEGYFSYWWKRLDTGHESEKLSYVRDFPAWGFVVGTGVYIDDVDQEVARRRQAMTADLRQHLRKMEMAGSGHVFIVDGRGDTVVHPGGLPGDAQGTRPNNGGDGLGAQLVAAAQRPDKTLFYQEGRPDDPAGGQQSKVAWVRRFPEYDWYLVASASVDDLGRSGRYLSERLLMAFVLGLVVTAGIAYAFIRRLTAPVLRLAEVARRNVAGDLAAVGDIGRRDEIGLLAAAFDSMVARLKEQIENLEDRVAERTRALSALTEELESRVEARMAEAKASEAKFRGLLEQSLAGIFVIRNDAFEYVNSRFAEIHGFADPAEIIGRYAFRHLVAPADLERVLTISRRFLEGRIKRCEMVFSGLHRDGSMVDLEVSARLIDYEGSPAMIGVVLDITERKKIQKVLADYQEQLEKMVATRTAQLEAANQQLQTFTYAASHDLKAPLRGIQSFSFLLEQNYRDQLAGDGVFYLQHIQRSASRMGELIEDLLAHAKMEQQDLDIQAVDLAEAVRSALAERQEEIRHRQADIHVDMRPTAVLADRQGVAQALRNIVENALKYSDPATPPVIEIGARYGEGTCCLWVRDNGIGFDMAYHDRIFEVFRRLHTYDEYPGSGVGLALVKKAMERMGGRVWATSAPGQGTTFHLEFRLAGAPAADSTPSLGMACSAAAA